MFVRNLGKKDIKFTIGGRPIILKAQGVTSVDEAVISRKDLKNAYGHNIVILGEDTPVEQKPVELTPADEQEIKDAIKDILLSLANVPIEERDDVKEELKKVDEKHERIEELKKKLTEDNEGTEEGEETQLEGTDDLVGKTKEETDIEPTGEEEKDEETDIEPTGEEGKTDKEEQKQKEAPAKQAKRRGGRKKKAQ